MENVLLWHEWKACMAFHICNVHCFSMEASSNFCQPFMHLMPLCHHPPSLHNLKLLKVKSLKAIQICHQPIQAFVCLQMEMMLCQRKQLQGDHVQLSFFKYFENGQKFIKNPKPSEKNTRYVRTFWYLRLLGPSGLLRNVTALVGESWILMVSEWKHLQDTN